VNDTAFDRRAGSASQSSLHAWIEPLSLALMLAMSVAIGVLNFHARHEFHTIEKHLVFRERILHRFAVTDVVPSYPIPPTFPMWGYGWVLLLTTNKSLLIALQMAVAVSAAWYLLRVIDDTGLLGAPARMILRLLIVCCTPWYAYHSIDWSQSLATSCLIFSVALLIVAVHSTSRRVRALALSAICLGLNLNFASDLYLLPIPMAFAYWWCAGSSRAAAAQALAWLSCVVLTLVPWMIYSWRATGTPLVKSTNQGHVLLLGLGQDPAGRFGFTYSDGDPRMYAILREQLGEPFARRFYASCSYEADQVLRPAFVSAVLSRPWDYLDLVQFKLRRIVTGEVGTYSGEIDHDENIGRFGVGVRIRNHVSLLSQRTGRLLQAATSVCAPLAIVAARRKRIWTLLLTPIAYQYVSCSLAALMPQYLSNVILFQLAVCAKALGMLFPARSAANQPGTSGSVS
jgi:hypothetical protein